MDASSIIKALERECVSSENAFELKGLGFSGACLAFYQGSKLNFDGMLSDNITSWVESIGHCAAPTYKQAIEFLLPKVSGLGKYRVIIVQKTGAYWLQEREGDMLDKAFRGISDETNEDCITQLIKIIKFAE